MENTKKTTSPASKTKKVSGEKKTKVSSSKLTAPEELSIPASSFGESCESAKYCKCQSGHKGHKKCLHLLLIVLLLANLAVGIGALCKLATLHQWIVMGSGGEGNLQTLERLYATPEYQDYFRGEISNLQTKIQTLNPAH